MTWACYRLEDWEMGFKLVLNAYRLGVRAMKEDEIILRFREMVKKP